MKSLLFALVVGALSLNFLGDNSTPADPTLALEHNLQTVHSMVQVDNARKNTTAKVVQIINRFNPGMSADLKQKLAHEILTMSVKYPNLDADLICATITHESARTWNPSVVSRAGALGLMQIMPKTGRALAKEEGLRWKNAEETLFNPIYNIRLGCRYLSKLIQNYDLEGGLAAYNGGWRRAVMWLKEDKADGILWDETQAYIPFVLKLYDEFKVM